MSTSEGDQLWYPFAELRRISPKEFHYDDRKNVEKWLDGNITNNFESWSSYKEMQEVCQS
jgi:hypothetical protein